MAALQQQGYKTVVCYGAEEAKTEIMDYLQDPERMPLAKCINAPWIGTVPWMREAQKDQGGKCD